MKYIQALLDKGWYLVSFDSRYSYGTFVMLSQNNDPYEELIHQLREDGELEDDLLTYVEGHGSWLPLSLAKNLPEALEKLDKKMANTLVDDLYEWHVHDAYYLMERVNLEQEIENGNEALLPPKRET